MTSAMRGPHPKRRWTALGVSWLLQGAILLVPILYLGWWGLGALLLRVNAILAHAEPLVSAIASQQVQRPVRIGRIAEDLRVQTLWRMFQHRDTIGTFPVRIDDIVISTKRTTYVDAKGHAYDFDEPALTRSDVFARAPHLTAYISLPTLLTGNVSAAVPRITIESPQVVIARDVRGQLNVQHILPTTPANKPPSPMFLTVAEATNGRVRFCDYQSLGAPGILQQNDLASVNASADLSTAATVRFTATGRAAPGTPTAQRVRGDIRADGSAGRTPQVVKIGGVVTKMSSFLVHVNVDQVDMAYWLPYLLNAGHANPKDPHSRQIFRVESGIATGAVTLSGPHPDLIGSPIPGTGIYLHARFAQGRVTTPLVPSSADDLQGSVNYDDGVVSLATTARVLDANVSAAGTLWHLTPDYPGSPQPTPDVAVNIHVQGLNANRALDTFHNFLPPNTLPPQLHIGGDVDMDALISGPANDPVASARVSGVSARFAGAPTARLTNADVAYSGGVLGLTNVSAALDGGGILTAHAAVRVSGKTLGTRTNGTGDAEFAVRAQGIKLDSLQVLRDLPHKAGGAVDLRLAGAAGVEAIGTVVGGTLSAAANVTTDHLAVGKVTVPVARARLLLTRRKDGTISFALPEARVESAIGAITASGVGAPPPGKLAVQWAATGLDMGAIAGAIGMGGDTGSVRHIAGLLSATGTIVGTPQDPRLTIRDLTGINLRATTTGSDGMTRNFAIDSVRGGDIALTRHGVALHRELVARRFPARFSVVGYITDLLPTAPETIANPHLHLMATLNDLEISEVERQMQQSVAVVVKKGIAQATGASVAAPPDVGGAIARATIAVGGTVKSPVVTGSATLGNVLVGAYPIDSGSFDFSYENRQAKLTRVVVGASVGTLLASATISDSGAVTGTFSSDRLDLEKLSYLLRTGAKSGGSGKDTVPDAHSAEELTRAAHDYGQPLVSGAIALNGSVQGTVHRIVVDARVPETPLKVYGLPLSGVAISGVRFIDNIDAGVSRLEVASLTVKQVSDIPPAATPSSASAASVVATASAAGAPPPAVNQTAASEIVLSNVGVEIPLRPGTSGSISAHLTAHADNIGALLTTLHKADLLPVDVATKVNGPVQGRVSIDSLQVHGRLISERGKEGTQTFRFADGVGDATLSADNLTVGGFSVPTVTGKVRLANERLFVDNLTATSPGATYRAHGYVGLDKKINVVAESNAASIDTLRTLPGLSGLPIIHGAVDLSVLAQGTISAPDVTASIEGTNLDLVIPTNPVQVAAVAAPTTAATVQQAATTFRFDVLRATAEYATTDQGDATLALSDGLLSHGSASIRLGGTIPLGSSGPATQRPISLNISAPAMNLAEFAPLFGSNVPTGTKAAAKAAPAKRPGFLARLFGKQPKKIEEDGTGGTPVDLGGTLAFDVALTGTLTKPQLAGTIDLKEGHFTLPKTAEALKDRINPIRDLEAHLVLQNNETTGAPEVDFTKFVVALGGLDGKKGNFGTINVGGTVGIGVLELGGLPSLLKPRGDVATQARDMLLQAPIAMSVAFNNFQPTDDNLLGLNEYFTAKANGTLTIGGDNKRLGTIGRPVIATLNSAPIRISDGDIRLGKPVDPNQKSGTTPTVAPKFNVPIVIEGKNTISPVGIMHFDVNGGALLAGDLAGTDAGNILGTSGFVVNARIKVVGGSFSLPGLARFTIPRNPSLTSGSLSASSSLAAALSDPSLVDTVELRYGSITPGIVAHHIIATTRQYVGNNLPTAKASAGDLAANGNNIFVASSQRPLTTSGPQTAYTITADIDGPLNIFNDESAGGADSVAVGSGKTLVTFSSVPQVPGGQAGILGILGAQQQLAQAAGGDAQNAANALVNRAIYASAVPTALAPITNGIQNALNLEDLSLSYDPSGYSQIFLAKRFPTPFDKVVVQYTQQIATRSTSGTGLQQQPFLFSVSYDLFRLRQLKSGIQPQVQTGFSTDEQHITTFFLRSSASF